MISARTGTGPGPATVSGPAPWARPFPFPRIRPLGPEHRSDLRAHYLRLTAEDRRRRFGLPLSDRAIDRLLDGMDWSRAVAFGAWSGGRVVGVGLIAWSAAGGPDDAEIALSVEPDWRRRGLGRRFALAGAGMAAGHGIPSLRIVTRPDNRAIVALAAGLGVRLALRDGELVGRIPAATGEVGSAGPGHGKHPESWRRHAATFGIRSDRVGTVPVILS